MKTKANMRKAEIRARVFRKKTGKWENLGVIARPVVSNNLFRKLSGVIKRE